jgi:hypothetical protein
MCFPVEPMKPCRRQLPAVPALSAPAFASQPGLIELEAAILATRLARQRGDRAGLMPSRHAGPESIPDRGYPLHRGASDPDLLDDNTTS